LDGNLADLIRDAKGDEAISKYKALRTQIPYVLFPLQTWLYIAGMLFGLDIAWRAFEFESGADPPAGLIGLSKRALRYRRGKRSDSSV